MSRSETTLKWTEVATLDDVWEGEMLEVKVDGAAVLLAHLPNRKIVAYQGICPHQEFALREGELDEDAEILTCSGHLWQFNIHTGHGVNPTGCSLYRYEVKIEGEIISVGYPADSAQHYNRCRED
jgi:toluene monooxygenase system ferredoxin subunit